MTLLDIRKLVEFLNSLFSYVEILPECKEISGLEQFTKHYFHNVEDTHMVQQQLKTETYYFRCIK